MKSHLLKRATYPLHRGFYVATNPMRVVEVVTSCGILVVADPDVDPCAAPMALNPRDYFGELYELDAGDAK